ncbi:hypothetical protein KUTeg_008259 [Tegillarca granosa]|uniref:Uncharacterized protein n=1 Tax=Tegillarca granosa TaxID=220873 RepID=A0ABQ9F8M2_TEGGR|nr:hypothetical protein KUTeg_008259 [Tegillarca granosa]
MEGFYIRMIVCMARPFSVRPSQRQIDQAKESETTATEKSEKTQRGRNPEKKTSLVKNQKTQFGENPEKCDSVVRSEKIQRGKIIERAASVGRNEKTQRVKITERDPSLVRRERLQKGNNFERDASLVRENKKDKDITTLIEDKIKILNQSAEKKQKSPGRLKEIDLDRIRLNSKSSVEYLVSKFNKNDKSDKNISCERVKSPTCSDKEYLLSKEDKKYCKSADDQCGGENELLGLPEEQQNDLSELPLEEQISDLAGLPLEKQINNFSRFPLEVQINDLSGLPLEDRIKSIVFNEESSFSDKTDNVFKFEKNEDLSPDLMPMTCQGHQQPKTSHRGNLLQSQVPTSHHKFNSGNSANITDSEKIYHRLNGVAKVSKPKIVSPRTRRLSGSRSRGSVKSPDTYRKNGIVISKVPTSSIDNYIESVKNDQVDMKIKTNLTGSCEPELVVRQCRVGSSVVFGLIQVQKEFSHHYISNFIRHNTWLSKFNIFVENIQELFNNCSEDLVTIVK